MKQIVFDRSTLLVIVAVTLILVVASTYFMTSLTRHRRVERIRDFIVLDDPYNAGKVKLYDDIVREVDYDFRFRLMDSLINQCRSGELFVKEYDKAILYVNCTLVKFRVNNSMIREGEPVEIPGFVPIAVSESGNYTFINPEKGFVRVYYTKLYLIVQLPENVIQGLTVDPDIYFNRAKDCYRIANIPYFYFNATFLKGAYNTWYLIKPTLSINGVNVTDPHHWRFSSNDNYSAAFPSVFDGYMSESNIMEYYNVLKPFLELTGNRTVTIVWYIEVYVYPASDFEIEFTIGYPALRVVKSA